MALNIADLAEHAIDAVPDRVALISGDETLTYAELEERANRLAHYLIDQGVKKDDKVSWPGIGSFSLSKRAARTGRNPQTGETMQIAASTAPAFKPAAAFKQAVAKG